MAFPQALMCPPPPPLNTQVQLQLYYLSVRVHRPLNVMCCTWNVGNAVSGRCSSAPMYKLCCMRECQSLLATRCSVC